MENALDAFACMESMSSTGNEQNARDPISVLTPPCSPPFPRGKQVRMTPPVTTATLTPPSSNPAPGKLSCLPVLAREISDLGKRKYEPEQEGVSSSDIPHHPHRPSHSFSPISAFDETGELLDYLDELFDLDLLL